MSPRTRLLAIVLTAMTLMASPLAPAFAIDIQRVVSPGGIEAWLVEDHKNPIVTLYAEFRGGEATDPAGKEGRANFVSGMLDEGAGDLDSRAFREAKESRSIRLSFDAGRDSFGASLSTLTEQSDEAFRLLRLALTEPRFDDEPLERVRAQILTGIRSRQEQPQTIASRVWWRTMFPDHPYGRPGEGTAESVAALGGDDLRGFVGQVIARDRVTIGVVGDITPDRLARALDEIFGALPASGVAPVIPEVTAAVAGELMLVEREVPQTVITFGHAGIKREDPDWYAATILMEVIGGGFGSRLTEEIREKRGLTYGVYAYSLPLDHTGIVAGGVSTRNDKAAESIRLVREIWAGLGAEGPTEKEVADAKTYINGSFPLRFTDSGTIARILASVQREKLGIDYLNRRSEIIDGVTMADLKRRRDPDPRGSRPEKLTAPAGLTRPGRRNARGCVAPDGRVPGDRRRAAPRDCPRRWWRPGSANTRCRRPSCAPFPSPGAGLPARAR
jgi:zinc protease